MVVGQFKDTLLFFSKFLIINIFKIMALVLARLQRRSKLSDKFPFCGFNFFQDFPLQLVVLTCSRDMFCLQRKLADLS